MEEKYISGHVSGRNTSTYSIDLKIVGDKEELVNIIRLFAFFKMCADTGSSRTIKVHCDGDGSFRMKSYVLESNGSKREICFEKEAYKEATNIINSGKDINLFIGE